MNRGAKIAIVGTLIGGLWWKYSRLPKIKVLEIIPDPMRPGIVFEMSCNGNTFRDTFYQGDERQVILSDDLGYYFISDPTETGVTLSIGVLNGNGGFDVIATGYIAYDYAGNDLPVRIAKKKELGDRIYKVISSDFGHKFSFNAKDDEDAKDKLLDWLAYHGMLRIKDDYKVEETNDPKWIHNEYVT